MLGRFRYAYLLATLALLVVGRPFLPDLGRSLVLGMLALSLITAAITAATRNYQIWIGIGTTTAIVFLSLSPHHAGRMDAPVLAPALGVVYWSFTAFFILRRILLRTTRVSADTINGAICVYLVMGLGWAQGYELLSTLAPGSFASGNEVITANHSFEGFIGFSFITLTTLGYGNIVPLTARAEALAIAEAITGQLYVAVLLARLVAMQIADRRDASSPHG